MAKREVCGNDYDKSFEINAARARHTFDSFECAIQALAPVLRALPLPGDRPRGRGERPVLLLRPLRAPGRRVRYKRPGGLTGSGKPGCDQQTGRSCRYGRLCLPLLTRPPTPLHPPWARRRIKVNQFSPICNLFGTR